MPAKVPRRWVGSGSSSAPAPDPGPEPKREYQPDRAWDKLLLLLGAAVVVVAILVVPGLLNRGGQNPVAEAAQATKDSSGVQIDFTATIQGPVQMTMRGTGVLNGETNRGAIGVNASVSGPVTSDFRMQEIVDDHDVYIRATGAGGELGLPTGWIRLSGDGFDTSSDGFLDGASTTSPSQLIDSLESESDSVAVVGHESLRGQDTTHYTANIDLGEFVDEVRDAGGDAAAELFEEGNSTETVDVWINDAGLLRRMTANANLGQLMTMNMTVDFSRYGIHPEINLPPDSQVRDIGGLQS